MRASRQRLVAAPRRRSRVSVSRAPAPAGRARPRRRQRRRRRRRAAKPATSSRAAGIQEGAQSRQGGQSGQGPAKVRQGRAGPSQGFLSPATPLGLRRIVRPGPRPGHSDSLQRSCIYSHLSARNTTRVADSFRSVAAIERSWCDATVGTSPEPAGGRSPDGDSGDPGTARTDPRMDPFRRSRPVDLRGRAANRGMPLPGPGRRRGPRAAQAPLHRHGRRPPPRRRGDGAAAPG